MKLVVCETKEILGKESACLAASYINEAIKDVMAKRAESRVQLPLTEQSDKLTSYIFPIIHGGDVCGAIITGEPGSQEGFALCMKTFSEILASMQE